MCEYCENQKPIFQDRFTTIDIEKDYLYINWSTEYTYDLQVLSFQLNYCPMCGRQLHIEPFEKSECICSSSIDHQILSESSDEIEIYTDTFFSMNHNFSLKNPLSFDVDWEDYSHDFNGSTIERSYTLPFKYCPICGQSIVVANILSKMKNQVKNLTQQYNQLFANN